jgi:hypothetical protein
LFRVGRDMKSERPIICPGCGSDIRGKYHACPGRRGSRVRALQA